MKFRVFLTAAVLATGLLLLVQACGSPASRCHFSTCDGCCDSAGVCRRGNEKLACGRAALACEECGQGAVCGPKGACVSAPADAGLDAGPCGPGNCSGCCDVLDQCLSFVTPAQCGLGGAACVVCAAAQSCSAGKCVGTTSCGGCLDGSNACVSGTEPLACGSGGTSCKACEATASCDAGQCWTPPQQGTGLRGEYFNDVRVLTAAAIERSDPNIDFGWGAQAPISGLSADQFSVRWTGQIEPKYTELYEFQLLADEGVRLWIDDEPVVDGWVPQGLTERTGSVALVAGTRHALRIEYFEATGSAEVRLSWSSPSQAREVVPASALFQPAPPDAGNGLAGDYFGDEQLASLAGTRADGPINFDWSFASPLSGMPTTSYSVRWTGELLPEFTESYTLYTRSDDGVRLWINGNPVLSDWRNHSAKENSGVVSLIAGRRYSVRLDYFQGINDAVIQLSWASPSQPKQLIPRARLFH